MRRLNASNEKSPVGSKAQTARLGSLLCWYRLRMAKPITAATTMTPAVIPQPIFRQGFKLADHILLTTLVASGLPHLLKTIFDQPRSDRLTVRGHWRGVPLSGNRWDAFPSGHAVHVGALASAAWCLPRRQCEAAWSWALAWLPPGLSGWHTGPRMCWLGLLWVLSPNVACVD
jgi:PAP2 superfamily